MGHVNPAGRGPHPSGDKRLPVPVRIPKKYGKMAFVWPSRPAVRPVSITITAPVSLAEPDPGL